MYVLVEHTVTDPAGFWKMAQQVTAALPQGTKLHHTFPSADGRRAVCLWEAPSVDEVRGFIEPAAGAMSRNEYYEVPNKDGVTLPSQAR